VTVAEARRDAPNPSAAITTNVSGDNGMTTSMDIPLNTHLELSGYYNRSVTGHDDTVSFGVTWLLRGRLKRRTVND
jgi:hypothetical protein